MTNVFKQIKQIFIDNKEYFIKCTFMSIIAALILGLAIGLSVPVSAAEEPTESNQAVITAGNYRWNDIISDTSNRVISVNMYFPDYVYEGITYTIRGIGIFVEHDDNDNLLVKTGLVVNGQEAIIVTFYSSEFGFDELNRQFDGLVPSGFGQVFTVSENESDDLDDVAWFDANTEFLNSSTATISAGTYFGVEVPSSGSFNVSFSFTSDSYDFDTFYVGTDYITYRMLTGSTRTVNAFDFTSDLWAFGFESITVPTHQTLPADFVTWFNSNYTQQNIPDPEPTYTIEAGYYKARDSFTISGWNVTNDSIRIRYYNDAINVQAYEVVDGISFISYYTDSGVYYASEIYYADLAVFTDSWNIDGAKNIQVLQDVTVSSDFYTVFNSVYAPSSEASNEFDSGYAAGYVDGRSDGYDIGYRQGYAEGLSDGDTNIFTDIIGGTLRAVDSFTIFGGFSLLDLISTLLGGMALVWILKLLAGG